MWAKTPGRSIRISGQASRNAALFRESEVDQHGAQFGGSTDFVQNFVMGEKKRGATFGQLINKKAQEFDWDAYAELGDILNERATGRRSADEITHHLNNNGCGMQFAAAGARILENARRMGLGTELAGDFFLQKEHT